MATSKPRTASLCFLALLPMIIAACSSGTAEEGSGGEAVESGGSASGEGGDAALIEWGYSGAVAPANWGGLSSEFSQCSLGKEQSPVDIVGATEGEPAEIAFDYADDGERLVNTGLFVRREHAGESRMRLGEREFTLLQAHSHNPSEHTLDGQSFPLEVHLVHQGEAGELAVVSVLFRLGAPNPAIQSMIDTAPQAGEPDVLLSAQTSSASLLPVASRGGVGGLDASTRFAPTNSAALIPADTSYYTYMGSLTTPPCTEGVEWIVMTETLEVSKEQLDQLSALTGSTPNNRPVQPLGNRSITLRCVALPAPPPGDRSSTLRCTCC